MEYFENNFTAPPNSDKIVMWRFLRNRRLILRLHRPTIFRALTYWAHRAVILAIAWFSCYVSQQMLDIKHLLHASHPLPYLWISHWSHARPIKTPKLTPGLPLADPGANRVNRRSERDYVARSWWSTTSCRLQLCSNFMGFSLDHSYPTRINSKKTDRLKP